MTELSKTAGQEAFEAYEEGCGRASSDWNLLDYDTKNAWETAAYEVCEVQEKLLAARDQRIAELEETAKLADEMIASLNSKNVELTTWLDKPDKHGWWLVKDYLEVPAYSTLFVTQPDLIDPMFHAMWDRHHWRFISE